MARARNIKPSIMDNEDLADLEPIARLLFIYLWMLADREGRLEDRPKRIAAQALAYDRQANVVEMLSSLEAAGFITRYTANGIAIIQINAFAKHQTPHIREAASALPSIKQSTAKDVPSTSQGSAEPSPRSPDSLIPDSLIPDSLIPDSLIPDSLIPDSDPPAQEARLDASLEAFGEFWATYPPRPGSSKADSLKAWKARVKEGVAPSALIEGAAKYAAYCLAEATEPKFIKQPATFLGPGEHYLSDWTPSIPQENEKSAKDSAFLRSIGFGQSPESHLLRIEEAQQ